MSNPTIERRHTGIRMSQSVKHAGLVYLSGQTSSGTDLADARSQTEYILARIDDLLAEAGSSRRNLLSALIHLVSLDDFGAMNKVWEAWLPEGAAPARTTVQAAIASRTARVEITVVAAVVPGP